MSKHGFKGQQGMDQLKEQNESENYGFEEKVALDKAQRAIGYEFVDSSHLLAAITHPSATEGKQFSASYERLEFLGDSILGGVVASVVFRNFPDLDEGGLTRIKVNLVAGTTLAEVAKDLGFEDFIIFGSSETGTGNRGLHSALENVYEAVTGALFLDGGVEAAREFVTRTLIPQMTVSMAREPENPKSALQEKLQEDGITPTYKLVETQGPPHDRTFVSQVFAGVQGLARGVGRTKKEAESQAAKSALDSLGEFFSSSASKAARAEKAAVKAARAAQRAEKKERERREKELAREQAKLRAKEEAQEKANRRAEEKARKKGDGRGVS